MGCSRRTATCGELRTGAGGRVIGGPIEATIAVKTYIHFCYYGFVSHGVLSTGAADDLAKASDIAHDMVTRYGMDEDLGFVAFEPQRQQMLDLPPGLLPQGARLSEETQAHIDAAIRSIVMDGFDHATVILSANIELLERGARALLEKETLDEAAIRELAQDLRRVDPDVSRGSES